MGALSCSLFIFCWPCSYSAFCFVPLSAFLHFGALYCFLCRNNFRFQSPHVLACFRLFCYFYMLCTLETDFTPLTYLGFFLWSSPWKNSDNGPLMHLKSWIDMSVRWAKNVHTTLLISVFNRFLWDHIICFQYDRNETMKEREKREISKGTLQVFSPFNY